MDTFYSGSEVLVPGELRGYRNWGVIFGRMTTGFYNNLYDGNGNEIVLMSIMQNYPWTVGLQKPAGCYSWWDSCEKCPVDHRPPSSNCSCGFYATHRDFPQDYNGLVLGSIAASGRIFLGTLGFRAEKVRIEALCMGTVPAGWSTDKAVDITVTAAAKYRVPWFESKEQLLAEFPPNDISALLPEEVVNA